MMNEYTLSGRQNLKIRYYPFPLGQRGVGIKLIKPGNSGNALQ
jgi:hypothetical protein